MSTIAGLKLPPLEQAEHSRHSIAGRRCCSLLFVNLSPSKADEKQDTHGLTSQTHTSLQRSSSSHASCTGATLAIAPRDMARRVDEFVPLMMPQGLHDLGLCTICVYQLCAQVVCACRTCPSPQHNAPAGHGRMRQNTTSARRVIVILCVMCTRSPHSRGTADARSKPHGATC